MMWSVTVGFRRVWSRYPILSDRNNNLRRQMGVPKAWMMTGRVTYVVDPDGVIRHMFSNLLDGPAHVREAERVIAPSTLDHGGLATARKHLAALSDPTDRVSEFIGGLPGRNTTGELSALA